jgi:hypothetical protein
LFEEADPSAGVDIAIMPAFVVGTASDGSDTGLVAAVSIAAVSIAAVPVAAVAVTIHRAVPAAAPFNVESVTLASRFRILDTDDGDAPVAARIADQLLAAATVDSSEAKVGHITRQGRRADHPPPLGRLALFGDETALIT